MKQVRAEVLSNGPAMEGLNLMWLRSPDLARQGQPGQFLMVRCSDGNDPLLRRALSIHRLQSGPGVSEETCAILYGGSGSGTEYLRRRQPGENLDVLGPMGHGFTVRPDSRSLLLLGTGWGLAPLIALAEQQVRRGLSVVLVAGAPAAAMLYPEALVPPEVELEVATEDGSAGHRGDVTELVAQHWAWADEVYASGPPSLYQKLAQTISRDWPRKSVQVLLDMPMACGVGACFACTAETKRGLKLLCREGPRLYLNELML